MTAAPGRALALTIILAGLPAFAGQSADDPTLSSATRNAIRAFDTCKMYASQRLKAPSTAKFPKYSSEYVRGDGPGPYEVTSYVDSQNPLGTYVRLDYHCQLVLSQSGQWSLVKLDIKDR